MARSLLAALPNLIEFFTKRDYRRRGPTQTIDDAAEYIIYLAPQTWAGRDIAEDDLMPAVELADALYSEHWSPISRFLQHCTDWRHELPKVWGYPTMHDKIEAVLGQMSVVMKRHRASSADAVRLLPVGAGVASGRCGLSGPSCSRGGDLFGNGPGLREHPSLGKRSSKTTARFSTCIADASGPRSGGRGARWSEAAVRLAHCVKTQPK